MIERLPDWQVLLVEENQIARLCDFHSDDRLAGSVGGPDEAAIRIPKNQVPGGGEVEGGTALDWAVTVGGPYDHTIDTYCKEVLLEVGVECCRKEVLLAGTEEHIRTVGAPNTGQLRRRYGGLRRWMCSED